MTMILLQKRKRLPRNHRNARRPKIDDDSSISSDDQAQLPSFARKTAKGGYAHTDKSRARISKANKGNTPWNKGKNRSENVKAKISAGVRARNRAVLLEKLRKLGMTEEEWIQKKKEIKYLRERVRKAKQAAEKQNDKKRKGKNAVRVCGVMLTTLLFLLANIVSHCNHSVYCTGQDIRRASEWTCCQACWTSTSHESRHCRQSTFRWKILSATPKKCQPPQTTSKTFFRRYSSLTSSGRKHDYDIHERLYEQLCPTGGPGGLACCEVCSAAYSRYLNQTSQDIETQSIHNAGTEVKECIGFMKETRDKLQKKVAAARTQAPPVKQDGATTNFSDIPTTNV